MQLREMFVIARSTRLLHLALAAAAGSLALITGPAAAAVLRVPSQYHTITHALLSAAPGDTVLVAPGSYYENVVWPPTQGLQLLSEAGAEATSIDGMGLESVIRMLADVDSTTVVRGFTIRNGSADFGGGIRCDGAAPTLADNVVVDNVATFYGGGIYCGGNRSPRLAHNTISGNTVLNGSGGGIGCYDDGAPTISDCTVTDNSADNYFGGGIHCEEKHGSPRPIVIAGCMLEGNTARGGGGLSFFSPFVHIPQARNNIVRDNAATYGGGIYAYWTCADMVANEISENHAWSHGGGIFVEESHYLDICNCEIVHNTAASAGGGIALVMWSTGPTVSANRILRNEANEGGGVYCYFLSEPTFRDNLIAFNRGYLRGGGFFCDEHCTPALYNNAILDNTAPVAGGLFFAESEPIITGCTIARNDDAGIYFDVPWERGVVTISGNSICDNVGYGLCNSHSSVELDARSNWWGDESGPHHPTLNPHGAGNPVSDYVEFVPWLTQPEGICAVTSAMKHGLQLKCLPNPFSATTAIRYWLPATAVEGAASGPPGEGSIQVFDVVGRLVRSFRIDGARMPGAGEVHWSGTDDAGHPVAGGVHYVRMKLGPWQEVRRITFLR